MARSTVEDEVASERANVARRLCLLADRELHAARLGLVDEQVAVHAFAALWGAADQIQRRGRWPDYGSQTRSPTTI